MFGYLLTRLDDFLRICRNRSSPENPKVAPKTPTTAEKPPRKPKNRTENRNPDQFLDPESRRKDRLEKRRPKNPKIAPTPPKKRPRHSRGRRQRARLKSRCSAWLLVLYVFAAAISEIFAKHPEIPEILRQSPKCRKYPENSHNSGNFRKNT